MRLATWNVNSLAARLPHVLDWLAQQQQHAAPIDVLALQELKMVQEKFPFAALHAAGLHAACFGQKAYNGVALLARQPLREVHRPTPCAGDESARLIAATVDAPGGPLRIVSAYFVNGQAPGSEKYAHKMRWLEALHEWLRAELAQHPRLILMGDLNIAPEDADSHDPARLADTICHSPQEKAHFARLLALGMTDAFRLFAQAAGSFTWWDYRQAAFRRNLGLRIDHILASAPLVPCISACTIDRTPRSWPRPSDHAPMLVELAGTG